MRRERSGEADAAIVNFAGRAAREQEIAAIKQELWTQKEESRNVGFIEKTYMGPTRRGELIGNILIALLMPSLDPSLVVGIDSMEVLKQDLATARSFRQLRPEEIAMLAMKVKSVATDGRHERFKSTQFYDSAYHQQQHGLTRAQVEGG